MRAREAADAELDRAGTYSGKPKAPGGSDSFRIRSFATQLLQNYYTRLQPCCGSFDLSPDRSCAEKPCNKADTPDRVKYGERERSSRGVVSHRAAHSLLAQSTENGRPKAS